MEEEKKEPIKEWHCDIYCRKIRHTKCEGQEHINPDAPDLCPFFSEMLYQLFLFASFFLNWQILSLQFAHFKFLFEPFQNRSGCFA